MKNKLGWLFGVAAGLAVLGAAPVQAKMGWNKKAKEADPGVTGCISCHSKEKPKKGEPLTERGQWLLNEQAKRKAADIDLEWLKDYPKKGK
jgi:cytochrome c553